jgi:hypothetical protein
MVFWYCWVMFCYACGAYEALYACLFSIKTRDMSNKGHIVHKSNKKTVKHKYRRKKNGKPQKRGPSKTNERLTRPHSSTVSQFATHARLPDNHEDPQKLRRLLRTQHHLPAARNAGKERLCKQRMEHENRKTTESLQTHNRRKQPAELHRKLTELHMQKNQPFNKHWHNG